MGKLPFASDYMEGAHPALLKALAETNLEPHSGYGTDFYCASAREKIRQACHCPQAEVHFLIGGTQVNALVISAWLKPWQGVLSADTGHINVHEAGAIEHFGHKVLPLPAADGKISAAVIEEAVEAFEADENREHMVMPGMVYLSQPTELGTLYSHRELAEISEVCRQHDLGLYVDGARLAYALACQQNDVSLGDLARLCDAFYIGGTKCGALIGEALVVPDPKLLPHFFTVMKQNGALLAKGRVLGVQFDAFFFDAVEERLLYYTIGADAIRYADEIRIALREAGFTLMYGSPTNQIFVCMEDTAYEALTQVADVSFWEKPDPGHTTIRIATSWATKAEEVNQLIETLQKVKS